MPNASQSRFSEVDNTFATDTPTLGIVGILANLPMGPLASPNILITSWSQFVKYHGGLKQGNMGTILAKRCLERGAAIRVCNVKHYTNPADKSTFDAVIASMAGASKVTTASSLASGHTLSIVIGATTFNQLFTTSAINTLNLMAAQINAAIAAGTLTSVFNAMVLNAQQIQIGKNGVVVITASASGTSAPAVTVTAVDTLMCGPTSLGTFKGKYPGLPYNDVVVAVQDASNGNSNYFNLSVQYLKDSTRNKVYPNLIVNPLGGIGPTAATSNYLSSVLGDSQLIDFVYADASGAAGTLRPGNGTWRLFGGTDGSAVVDADYIGDSSGGTGLFSFDGVGDIIEFGALDNVSSAFVIAASAYANQRQDIQFFHHFDNSLSSADAIAAARDALLVDSSYVQFFTGGVVIADPFIQSSNLNINGIADALAIHAYSDLKYGTNFSAAGARRGLILNSLGVVNNFGAPGNYLQRNLLANHGINTLCVSNGRTLLKGNFTGQVALSQLSFANIRKMIIGLKKELGPLLELYLEEPNDFKTWKNLFIAIKPTLKKYKDNRAIYDYSWQGDQFATSIDNLQVNNAVDVGLGKYKARLYLKAINSLQDLLIEITLSNSGVSFEDNLSSLTQSVA